MKNLPVIVSIAVALIFLAEKAHGLDCYECLHYEGGKTDNGKRLTFDTSCKAGNNPAGKLARKCETLKANEADLEPICMKFHTESKFLDQYKSPATIRACLHLQPSEKQIAHTCKIQSYDEIYEMMGKSLPNSGVEQLFYEWIHVGAVDGNSTGEICTCSGNHCNSSQNIQAFGSGSVLIGILLFLLLN